MPESVPTTLPRKSGDEGGGAPSSPWRRVRRSYIREQRLEAFYRLFYPTTPLPECGQVSFLMGGIHQAGMEQRSGFEPPLPAWKAGVLTVEH